MGQENGAMTTGIANAMSLKDRFWLLGGSPAADEFSNLTYYYDAQEELLSQGVDLMNGNFRMYHCVVNAKNSSQNHHYPSSF